MLAKRIIACLDIKDGKTVKGVNFENLVDAGDPVELAKRYSNEGIDELVFLDITATNQKRKTTVDLVKRISKEIFIPFTVGGGIKTIDDIKDILNAGADKVSINSQAFINPDLIKDCVKYFGSQCIVVAIDAKKIDDDYYVFINAGKKNTGVKLLDWAHQVEEMKAGEILLTSMDADGTQGGFDIEMNKLLSDNISIPVIASGGAGPDSKHFIDLFKQTKTDAALAASIFHFQTLSIMSLKSDLRSNSIPTR